MISTSSVNFTLLIHWKLEHLKVSISHDDENSESLVKRIITRQVYFKNHSSFSGHLIYNVTYCFWKIYVIYFEIHILKQAALFSKLSWEREAVHGYSRSQSQALVSTFIYIYLTFLRVILP